LHDRSAENAEVAASKARGEHLSWGDLRRMKLSWRVVQESMRLTPPANTMLRRATHETSFGGFRIPESWTVRGNIDKQGPGGGSVS
jgi:cytochrome P450